jgi:hypothetical protein
MQRDTRALWMCVSTEGTCKSSRDGSGDHVRAGAFVCEIFVLSDEI